MTDSENNDKQEENSESISQNQDIRAMSLDPNKDVLEHAISDTREYINIQIDTVNQLGNRAGKTVRLNLIIIGLIFTILTFLNPNGNTGGVNITRLSRFVNLYLVAGAIASAESMLLAFWTYNRTRVYAGLNVRHIEKILNDNYSEFEFLTNLLKGHKSWISKNQTVNTQDAHRLVISNTALLLAVIYFGLAVLSGFHQDLVEVGYIPMILVGYTVGLLAVAPYIFDWVTDSDKFEKIKLQAQKYIPSR